MHSEGPCDVRRVARFRPNMRHLRRSSTIAPSIAPTIALTIPSTIPSTIASTILPTMAAEEILVPNTFGADAYFSTNDVFVGCVDHGIVCEA